MTRRELATASLAVALLATSTFAQTGGTTPATPAPATAPAPADAPAKQDLIATATAAGQFQVLLQALQIAGLTDALRAPGPVTVFAPTDAAFAKIPKRKLDALLKDPAKLKKILTYHVVPGSLKAAEVVKLKDGTTVKTLNGKTFTVYTRGGQVHVNKALVTATDIEASNGVIHVIDAVLLP